MAQIPIKNLIPGTGANETLRFAGAPVSGVGGTYAGRAPVGVLLVDTTNADLYQNTGTVAVPVWTANN